MKTPIRKIFVSALLGTALLLSGCRMEKQPEKVGSLANELTLSEQDTPTVQAVYQVGDIISVNNTVLIVLGWDEPPGGDFNPPAEGKKYVAVDLLVANQGTRSFSVSPPFQMTLKDDSGQKYNVNAKANTASGVTPPRGEVNPGEQIRGKAGFQVPQEASGFTFVYEHNLIGLGEVNVDLGPLPVSMAPPESLQLSQSQPVFAVGESVEISNLMIQVLGVSYPIGTDLIQPKEGYQYVVVELMVVNQGDSTQEITSGLQMYLKDGTGQQYPFNLGAQALADAGLPDDELQPGERIRGQIGFQVPESAENLVFVFDAEVFGFGKVFISLR